MTIAPPWRPGTRAAERREEAVRRIIAGQSFDEVQHELQLNRVDERLISQHIRAAYPWLAIILGITDDASRYCPNVAPHPALPTIRHKVMMWFEDSPGDGRVVEYTCTCGMTSYELLSYGGIYRIRRTTEAIDVPPISYTGGWRRPEAYGWWRRLLMGSAR